MKTQIQIIAVCSVAVLSSCSLFPRKIPEHSKIRAVNSNANLWSYEKVKITGCDGGVKMMSFAFTDLEIHKNCVIEFEAGLIIEVKDGKLVSGNIPLKANGDNYLNYFVENNKISFNEFIRTFR